MKLLGNLIICFSILILQSCKKNETSSKVLLNTKDTINKVDTTLNKKKEQKNEFENIDEFLSHFKQTIKENEKLKLEKFLFFPFTIYLSGDELTFNNYQSFLKSPEFKDHLYNIVDAEIIVDNKDNSYYIIWKDKEEPDYTKNYLIKKNDLEYTLTKIEIPD